MPIQAKLLLATVFWGATPTIGRILAVYEAPIVVVCGRFVVAAVFLWWFTLVAGKVLRIPRRYWWRLALLGFSGIVLHNGLMYKGLEYTDATTTSIILALIAIQVVVLDLVIYRRLPDRLALAGVLLAFVGTLFVITDGQLGQIHRIGLGVGELLAFLSALSWAIYSVLGRPLLEEFSPLLITTYATTIGVFMMLPSLFQDTQLTITIFSDGAAVAMLFLLGTIGSALGFLWYYEAVVEMGTVGAAVFINLVPVFGVLSAVIFLGESPNAAVLGGALLVMGGLIMVNRPWSGSRVER